MADWLSKGDIPVGQDAPPVLSDHLLAYEVHLRQHIAVLRQAVPKTIFLAMHTYTRRAGRPDLCQAEARSRPIS